ncbi:RHS repeat-associated core domain-containing protein [Flavobacterium branchiophilum]|uniref:RHS repeat domain-containing protein n=1 Tax=Flavobacterium branchiophilum TaxID=55197 RepID=UPI0018D37D99|nr:RHS repeat-associated core domain-containing protein [Flavobacterium branchiophilum]
MGEVTQHSEYFVFGESFVEEHKNSHNSPYKFNGKELDEESGLYYYGARYYDARISIWASVDPLMEDYPNIGGYTYCANNPVNIIDPDGRFLIDVHKRITRNSFSSITNITDKIKLKNIILFRRGLIGNGLAIFDGSVVAPDVRSLPWYLGGYGHKSIESDHFDCMNYKEILLNFTGTFKSIETAINSFKNNKIDAVGLAKVIGEEYHAIQDFYSHSNYIEIYKEVYGETAFSKIPTLQEALSDSKYEIFADKLKKDLKTGIYPGTGENSHKGMNHDIGCGSSYEGSVPEVEGKKVNWNTRAAEKVATRATKQINDKVENAILTK